MRLFVLAAMLIACTGSTATVAETQMVEEIATTEALHLHSSKAFAAGVLAARIAKKSGKGKAAAVEAVGNAVAQAMKGSKNTNAAGKIAKKVLKSIGGSKTEAAKAAGSAAGHVAALGGATPVAVGGVAFKAAKAAGATQSNAIEVATR
jgi:hypothetical protein